MDGSENQNKLEIVQIWIVCYSVIRMSFYKYNNHVLDTNHKHLNQSQNQCFVRFMEWINNVYYDVCCHPALSFNHSLVQTKHFFQYHWTQLILAAVLAADSAVFDSIWFNYFCFWESIKMKNSTILNKTFIIPGSFPLLEQNKTPSNCHHWMNWMRNSFVEYNNHQTNNYTHSKNFACVKNEIFILT